VPRPKAEFDQLFTYEVYEPVELLDPDQMYTVAEIARLLQDLPAEADLDPETEERILAWTIPWLFAHREQLTISDPVGDEPGYFGLRESAAETDESGETA
jgi:hypothetical protein